MATAEVTTNGSGVPAVQQPKDVMEFVPFMAKESIKLSVAIVQKMLCVPTKAGRKCDDVQAMRFMMLCKARQLNPFEGDAYLVGYDTNDGPQFSLITAHQAFLKRAEVHPEYDGMDSGVIVLDADKKLVDREGDFFLDDDTLVGGWATVFFKERKHPIKKRLKLTTFNTGLSRWRKDPAGMIVKCAEADALRSAFPTSLGGLYIDGELPTGSGAEHPKRNARVASSDLTDFARGASEPTVIDAKATSADAMPDVEAVQDILDQLNAAVDFGDIAAILNIERDFCGDESDLTTMQRSIVTKAVEAAKANVGQSKQQPVKGELFPKDHQPGD